MKRLITGILAAVVLASGCSDVPRVTPLPSPVSDAALAELCGTDETSRASITTELDAADLATNARTFASQSCA